MARHRLALVRRVSVSTSNENPHRMFSTRNKKKKKLVLFILPYLEVEDIYDLWFQ